MQNFAKFLFSEFKIKAGLLIAVTVVLYGFLINNLNLWSDEIYSVLMAKDSLNDMWTLLINEDSKPPLYYLYLKGILALFPEQYEIWAAHFASVLLLIIAQLFAATAVKKDYGDKTALWLIWLLMVMPASLWLAFEVRTYMLSGLLLMMASVYGLRLLEKPKTKDFVLFGIVSLLALYSHYYCALWLMFFYAGILFFMIRDKKFKANGPAFLLTALGVAMLFAPWLWVPFNSGENISRDWYVNSDFVKLSWQFWTNPLQPEIYQSSFFIATTLSASVFSFILLIGLFNPMTKKVYRAFVLCFGAVIAVYALLIIFSYTFRPMVTARYLKIFAPVLYLAGAYTLAQYKILKKAFALVSALGFIFTYADIHAISFDNGYQNLVHDIRRFVPKEQPLIAFDNSNLFCEYYLPEYHCLLNLGETGEYFRLPQMGKNIDLYKNSAEQPMLALSLYTYRDNDKCMTYHSNYRYGQNMNLCHYNAEESKIMLSGALSNLLKRLKRY